MSFNFKLILEIQEKSSLKRSDIANLLGISDNYLYRIERGLKQPSLELIQQISAVMGVPVTKLLDEQSDMTKHGKPEISEAVRVLAEMESQLEETCKDLLSAEKHNLELGRTVEHLKSLIDLHVRFEDIVYDESLPKSQKMKKLEELAKTAAKEGKAGFEEIRTVLRVKRAILRKWLRSIKQAYPCKFAENGELVAFTPGGAALQLRCFDCKAFESGECEGYGNEKRPENIIELVTRLEINGMLSRAEQAQIIGEAYNTPISKHELSEVIYRYNHGQPIAEGIFYMDRREKKRQSIRSQQSDHTS
jgi:transcriptional regulator with XRE-family HTH domain